MLDLTRLLLEEVENFLNSINRREYVIDLCEELFDEHFVPVDLPGPDQIIDPLLRTAIRPIVGRIYDEILKKLEK